MSDYTHTRISREYLYKLQVLATRNKRSAMKQLEVLIDRELATPAAEDGKGE
jgi:hypothetical protein